MSFVGLIQNLRKERQQLYEQFKKKANQLPQQLEKTILAKQNKLEIFIQNFQNQILMIRKASQRDCKQIQILKLDNAQRKSQSHFLQSATKMQEHLVQRLKQVTSYLNQSIKEAQVQGQKHWQLKNRAQLDLQNLNSMNTQNSKNNNFFTSPIEIDRNTGKMLIRIDKNGTKTYEIFYNKRDDKFSFGTNIQNKALLQTVAQFNFHRDVSRLYQELYKFS